MLGAITAGDTAAGVVTTTIGEVITMAGIMVSEQGFGQVQEHLIMLHLHQMLPTMLYATDVVEVLMLLEEEQRIQVMLLEVEA